MNDPVAPGTAETTRAPRPIVALMQPTFLPWCGYFALMDSVDEFVVLDDFQFVRQSFQQRNRLFQPGANKVDWVTVPIVHPGSTTRPSLAEVVLQDLPRFRRKTLATLRQSYARCADAEPVLDMVDREFASEPRTLGDLNLRLIRCIASAVGIQTPIRLSSTIGSTGRRSERVASLLANAGARTYYAARGAYEYMRADGVFPIAGIDTYFQRYHPVPYPQRHSEAFVPYLSALDLVLQVGRERALAVIRAGAEAFEPWEQATAVTSDATESFEPPEV